MINMEAYYEILRDNIDTVTLQSKDYATWPAHFHQHVEIFFVEKGKSDMVINGKWRTVRQGDIAFCDSYDIHEYADILSEERWFYTLIIPYKYCQRFHALTNQKTIENPYITDEKLCAECILTLKEIEKNNENEYIKQSYIDLILSKLLQRYRLVDRHHDNNLELLREVLSYINGNISQTLTLNTVAARFGYSPSHFSRIFQSSFHCKLGSYVTSLRLKTLEQKIKDTGYSNLNNIIYECGFASLQTFYRVFLDYYKVTPKKYFSKNTNSAR